MSFAAPMGDGREEIEKSRVTCSRNSENCNILSFLNNPSEWRQSSVKM
jgi:hypothetical protein